MGFEEEPSRPVRQRAAAEQSPADQGTAHGEAAGHRLVDVSNALVRLYKRYYGRGPVKARAHIDRDLLTVVLEGGFSPSERMLAKHGGSAEVVASRNALRGIAAHDLEAAVEQASGRRVRSFLSAIDPKNEIEVASFVLEPQSPRSAKQRAGLIERATLAREQHQRVLEEHLALRAEQIQSRRAMGHGPPSDG